MFKIKDFGSEAENSIALQKVKSQLDELPSKIDVIKKYTAGTDVRKLSWSYDIVLEMDFETMADLDVYTVHPAHQQFIDFNKDFSVAKVCIDFEI
jgi:hypothetical protein